MSNDILSHEQAEALLDLLADNGLCPVIDWVKERDRLARRGPFGASYVTAYGGCVVLVEDGTLRYFGDDAEERALALADGYGDLLRQWGLAAADEELVLVLPGARSRLSWLAD